MNSDQPASTATNRCRPIHLRRASVHMNARSAPLVSTPSWETSVRTAVEVLCPGQSGQRRIGKAITILARIQQAPRSNIDPWTLRFMRGSRLKSSLYRLRRGNSRQYARLATPSSRSCIGAALLWFLHAGYGERSAVASGKAGLKPGFLVQAC